MAREIATLRREIAELRAARRGPATAVSDGTFVVRGQGGFRVIDPDTDETTFYTGPGSVSGKQVILWNRHDGTRFLGVDYVGDTEQQVASWRDQNEDSVIADDQGGIGLAEPYLGVPMYPRFVPVAPAAGSLGIWRIADSTITTAQIVWEGRIPMVVHPTIRINGVWGRSTGAGNITYTLNLDDEPVGTWVKDAAETSAQGPFDITPWFKQHDVKIQVTAQAAVTSAGQVWMGVYGVHTRGT